MKGREKEESAMQTGGKREGMRLEKHVDVNGDEQTEKTLELVAIAWRPSGCIIDHVTAP
jgi:hypothetical protein